MSAPDPALPTGLHLLFPGDAAYAQRYLTAARANGKPVHAWRSEAEIDAAVLASIGAPPKRLDRALGLAALAAPARAELLSKEALLTTAMRRAFPVLDQESIAAEDVTITAEPWGLAPLGSLYYARRTNFGQLVVVAGTIVVDAATGTLAYRVPSAALGLRPVLAVRTENAASLALASDGAGIDTLKSVLGVLQMVLFAVGPEGVLLAAGIGFLELLFGPSQKPVDLPKVINELVVQDFANHDVAVDLSQIVAISKWLSEQRASVISGQSSDTVKSKFADAYKDLYGYVVTEAGPQGRVFGALADLQGIRTSDPPWHVLGLPAFLLGASLRLLLMKIRLLFSTDATTFRSPETYEIVNTARDYLTYLNDTVAVIDKAFSDRLGGIGAVTQGDFVEVASGTMGSTAVSRHYAYIIDSAAATFPEQAVLVPTTGGASSGYEPNIVWYSVCYPKGCSSTGSCDDGDTGPVEVWRTAYIQGVTAQLDQKFATAQRRADIKTVQDMLNTVISTYAAAAPPVATTPR
jgi:hypothetical protein